MTTPTHDELMRLSDEWCMNSRTFKITSPYREALSTAIQQVLAERDALAKDAARYRWLATGKNRTRIWNHVIEVRDTASLEEAIDEAMKGQTP